MIASLYWVHLPHHVDVLTQGYIGVSIQSEVRLYGHRWALLNEKHINKHLTNAFKKYGEENIMDDILLVGPEEYCYEMEKKLRPDRNIGWNIAPGGYKPPSRKGIPSWNKGLTKETDERIARQGKHLSLYMQGKNLGPRAPYGKQKNPSPKRLDSRTPHSEETKRKIGMAVTGEKNGMYGKRPWNRRDETKI
jgi:hypothetical protein